MYDRIFKFFFKFMHYKWHDDTVSFYLMQKILTKPVYTYGAIQQGSMQPEPNSDKYVGWKFSSLRYL